VARVVDVLETVVVETVVDEVVLEPGAGSVDVVLGVVGTDLAGRQRQLVHDMPGSHREGPSPHSSPPSVSRRPSPHDEGTAVKDLACRCRARKLPATRSQAGASIVAFSRTFFSAPQEDQRSRTRTPPRTRFRMGTAGGQTPTIAPRPASSKARTSNEPEVGARGPSVRNRTPGQGVGAVLASAMPAATRTNRKAALEAPLELPEPIHPASPATPGSQTWVTAPVGGRRIARPAAKYAFLP
jgi:hypothetical protein